VDYDKTLNESQLAEIRGDKYKSMNAKKPKWEPRIYLTRWASVIVEVDEKTNKPTKIQKKWVPYAKFSNLAALFDDEPYWQMDQDDDQPVNNDEFEGGLYELDEDN
jgi:hypothetical protein